MPSSAHRATPLLLLLSVIALICGLASAAPSAAVAKAAPTTVSITFDDGVADQMEAVRLLNERSLKGTFYVISGRIGSSGYLTLANLHEMDAAGHEIGDHTVNHLNLLNVSPEEARRQVCNARVALQNWGFHVWDFAYPQGGTNPELEQIVRECNLSSARIVSNLVSPGACNGCAYSETIPPRDPYSIQTPDAAKSYTTLADLKGEVIQAQEHGGGWVPLVFHHLCGSCDTEGVSAQTFGALLDWLRSEEANGVSVKTVHEVIGGEEKPGITGPEPPAPSGDLLANPSLEADLNGNGVPDCWTAGGSGANTYSAAMTPDASSGAFGEQIQITSFTSGDRRLVTTQDLGQCAPPATPGHTYTASAQIKGEGSVKWVVYYRDAQGTWSYWTQSNPIPLTSAYAATHWSTPTVPAAATALSIGVSLRSAGNIRVDDFFLADDGPGDATPPAVAVTAPANGATISGKSVYISAQATDNVNVASVRFYLDGTSLGSKTTPTVAGGSTYQWKWDTTGVVTGAHNLTAVATDGGGNQASSSTVTVNLVGDTTAPTTSITCNGGSECGGLFHPPVTIGLPATDDVGVSRTVYTTDGSEPTATNGVTYSGPFTVSQTTTLRYRSTDAAGNWEAPRSTTVTVDPVAPTSSITSPTSGSTIKGNAVYITAQATDNIGVASVRFYLDGTSLGSKTAPTVAGGSTYQWKLDATTIAPGSHTLTATATDTAGNQTASAPVSVTVAGDTVAPTTTIACNGSSACGGWLKGPATVTLKATDDVGVSATYYTLDGSEPSSTNGTVYSGPFQVSGQVTVKFRSVDAAGNLETTQAQALKVDSVAPSAAITAPASGATVGGNYYITAQATDDVGVASVRFYLDGASLGSKTSPTVAGGSSYQWRWDTNAVAKGTHTLTVVATDLAGNQVTSAPVSVTVS